MTSKLTKKQLRYWDKILIAHDLGVGRGRSTFLDTSGGLEDLDKKLNQKIRKRSGRVAPKGAGPDK